MKKITNFIAKHDNIFMLIFIVIIASMFSYDMKLDANDELWNFSNIYKMYNGYTIYKDTNVIITPLYFWIGQILFSIFGANYIVFRTYQTVIPATILFYIMYKTLKKLGIKKSNSAIYVSLIETLCTTIVVGNYNILAIAFAMIGVYYLILNKSHAKQCIIQPIIVVLVFLTKQNIGIFYLISLIIYQLILEKQNIITKVKTVALEGGIITVLLFIFYTYMQKQGIWGDFANYAFSGIGEFATKNLVGGIQIITVIALTLITIAPFIIFKKFKVELTEEQKRNMKILATFSIIMEMIAYPIFNNAHILIGSIIHMAYMSYIINTIITLCLKDETATTIKKVEKIKIGILTIIIVVISFLNIYTNIQYIGKILNKDYYFEKASPYYGSIIKKEKQEEIEEIVNYIKQQNQNGTEVKIISYYSNLYMNILNRSNGDFDLPFYGNLGKAGEDGMIEKIKKLKNTNILILTKEDDRYQESQKVMNYIKNNLKCIGKIQQFSIYKAE